MLVGNMDRQIPEFLEDCVGIGTGKVSGRVIYERELPCEFGQGTFHERN